VSDLQSDSDFQKNVLRHLKRIDDVLDRLKNYPGGGAATGFVLVYSTYNCHNPPTQADLTAAFGAAATRGTNFLGLLNDDAGGTHEYLVGSDGTNFWFVPFAKGYVALAPATIPDLTYVFANGKTGRARNFVTGGTSLTWEDVTGSVAGSGTGTAFICDTVDPKHVAYRVWVDVVEIAVDLDNTTPTWTSILTAADVQAALGNTGVAFAQIDVSRLETDLCYVAWKDNIHDGVSVTFDRGASWAHHKIGFGGGGANGEVRRVVVDPLTLGKVWFCGGNGAYCFLLVSTNYGASWGINYAPAFTTDGDFDIGSNGLVAILRQATHLYYSGNGGSSWTQSPTAITSSALWGALCLSVAADDNNDVLWGEQNGDIWHSTDAGVNYSLVTTLTGTGFSTQKIQNLRRWRYDKQKCFWLRMPGGISPPSLRIGYSTDTMATLIDKTSNWAALMGGAFDKPVAICPVELI